MNTTRRHQHAKSGCIKLRRALRLHHWPNPNGRMGSHKVSAGQPDVALADEEFYKFIAITCNTSFNSSTISNKNIYIIYKTVYSIPLSTPYPKCVPASYNARTHPLDPTEPSGILGAGRHNRGARPTDTVEMRWRRDG